MPSVHAVFPAPWWTPLSYSWETELAEGLRVSAPLGRGGRIGVTVDAGGGYDESKTKPLSAVIDECPPLPPELWKLIKWFGATWFIGTGFAMKTLLPSKFFSKEKLPQRPERESGGKFAAECFYSTDYKKRWERYRAALEEGTPALALFPEAVMARAFWESLPPSARDGGALWPETPARRWKLWKLALAGELRFIVGPPGAAFVPLSGLSTIIMDDENNGGWRSQNHPVFNARPLLGKRAEFTGARFLLGGSMPSSKIFLGMKPQCEERGNDARLVFVDTKEAQAAEFASLSGKLPVSVPLLRETAAARARGGWAMWLLDRKGYAGELYCEECGWTARCPRCGSAMRWEERRGRLRCVSCGERAPLPERCPNCGGLLMRGSRPGLEALFERAEGALRGSCGSVLLFQNDEEKIPTAEELIKQYPHGALLIGTRKLLSLCGGLAPSVIGWIDAGAEARSEGYDARARAYAMLWESMWRGGGERRAVVQSRRPGAGWQDGLRRGWGSFWTRELRERRELELPPFVPMIKITASRAVAEEIAGKLADSDMDFWQSDEDGALWVRTKRFAALSAILAPYFDISRSGKAFPSVLLYLD